MRISRLRATAREYVDVRSYLFTMAIDYLDYIAKIYMSKSYYLHRTIKRETNNAISVILETVIVRACRKSWKLKALVHMDCLCMKLK